MRALILVLVLALPIGAQTGYGRTRRGSSKPISTTGGYKDLAGIFHGKLKNISGKEIAIENEDGQIVAIRRTRKTKFYKDEHEIKATDIALDTPVTIEAPQDIDLKPMAMKVTVDSEPKKTLTTAPKG